MSVAYCMYCGTRILGDHRFCMGCGRPLGDQVMPSEQTPAPVVSAEPVRHSTDSPFTFDLDEIYGRLDADEEIELPTKVYSDQADMVVPDDAHVLDEEIELPTTVYASKNDEPISDDMLDEEDASATLLFPKGPHLCLRRLGTGELMWFYAPATIGRGSKCTVRILGNRFISRLHAEIEQDGEGFVVIDRTSSNSTFVNGLELETGSKHPLRQGDHLRLADEELVFEVE